MAATTKFLMVMRSTPMCPAMRRPGTTRWKAVEPMEPALTMTILLAVGLRTTTEVVTLDDASEAAALHDAAHADLVPFLENINGDRVAKIELLHRNRFRNAVTKLALLLAERNLDRLIAVPLARTQNLHLISSAWTTVTGTTFPSFQIWVIFNFLPRMNDIALNKCLPG